ncbi:MAG: siphovirus Gp157 family protein [Candidatus Solibacter sp.]
MSTAIQPLWTIEEELPALLDETYPDELLRELQSRIAAFVVVDEAAIPRGYIVEEVVTTRRVDKSAIKNALNSGADVPGTDLEYCDNLVQK